MNNIQNCYEIEFFWAIIRFKMPNLFTCVVVIILIEGDEKYATGM